MEVNLLKEISYLTRLIEDHKKLNKKNNYSFINNKKREDERKFNYILPAVSISGNNNVIEKQSNSNGNSNFNYIKPDVLTTAPLHQGRRVHLNPNFKPKVPGIHVNPRIGETKKKKSSSPSPSSYSVYVNPKMMKNFSNHNQNQNQNCIKKLSDSDISEENYNKDDKKCPDNLSLKKKLIESSSSSSSTFSVHVNPKLMKELSSSSSLSLSLSCKEKSSKTENGNLNNERLCKDEDSRTNDVKSNSILLNSQGIAKNSIKKAGNSNLISLSRRKLVRIRRSSKIGSSISSSSPSNITRVKQRLFNSNSNIRKTRVSTKYKLVMEQVETADSESIKNRQAGRGNNGLNKYKIDRTHLLKVERRLSIGKNNNGIVNNKSSGSTTGLVRIGGILYKSSRNQLIRSINDRQQLKKKRCIINVKGDRFVMASNGKKLRRLNGSGTFKSLNLVSRVHIGGMTFVEKTPNVLVRKLTKNNISTKAKQRSIQILRNKMRKNNQPCLIFQKFGYCTNNVKGTCPKLHDAKQVALCRNFLQGKCFMDNCPMSHSVCPEKMPTCKYFLEGCCIRDQCPYLHVKVSSNTPICSQFLRGYCAEANKCKQRHEYICPDFERTGNCAKGKYCPYPHKRMNSKDNKKKKLNKMPERKCNDKSGSTRKRMIIIKKEKLVAKLSLSPSSNNEERKKRYYDESGSSKKELEKKRRTILRSINVIKDVKLAEINAAEDTNKTIKNNDKDDRETGPEIFQNHFNNQSEEKKEEVEEDNCPKRTPLGPLPAYIPID